MAISTVSALIFGASTSASAAVIAVFMGGLGLGGWLIGPRADQRRNPLLFHARLEGLVAVAAAATPGLLALVRQAYIGLGGTVTMGAPLGTIARLLLAVMDACDHPIGLCQHVVR